MKSYNDWKMDEICEEVDMDLSRLMGPSSALGTSSQRAESRLVTKLRALIDDISEWYPDPAEALNEIIKAATMLLGRTSQTFTVSKALRGLRRGAPEVTQRELPGEEVEDK